MGLATIIEEITPASPMPKTGPAPARTASVLRFTEDGKPINPRQVEPPAQGDPANEPDQTIVQGSRARAVYDTPMEEAEPEAPAINEDDLSDVEKVRLNASRKISEQGSEIGALRKQLADVLEAFKKQEPAKQETIAAPQPDLTAIQAEMDAVSKRFIDDPEGSAKKMMELSMKAAQLSAQASVMPMLKQSKEEAALAETRALVKQYPGLVNNKAEAAYIDTAADMLAQEEGESFTTIDHYKKAMDAYAKKIGYERPTVARGENAEVAAMRKDAQTAAPASASVPSKSKGKIWRKSELDALLTRQPQKYKDLQPEIMRAYREGRVK